MVVRRPFREVLLYSSEAADCIRSEADCRASIATVQFDAYFTTLRRCVAQLEMAWRSNFHGSVVLFHRAVVSRSDSLKKEVEETELASYHNFVAWAEEVSQWYDDLWATSAATMSFCYCNAALRMVESDKRRALIVGERLDFLKLRESASRDRVARSSIRGLFHLRAVVQQYSVVAHEREAMFGDTMEASNAAWTGAAMQLSVRFAVDLYRLSELECIKYQWALLYRMEQAARRRVVWLSLLSACQLAESWERLFVLQVYARRTGELLWFHDEQRFLVILDNEAKQRHVSLHRNERDDRRSMVDQMFFRAQTMTAKQCLVAHKELLHRATIENHAISQRSSIVRAANHVGCHIIALLSEHQQQRLLLSESEGCARAVLTEFLLSHYQLMVEHWIQTERSASLALLSSKAMIPFSSLVDDVGFERGSTLESQSRDNAAWDYIYTSPMVARASREAAAEPFGFSKFMTATPPPYSAVSVSRRLQMNDSLPTPLSVASVVSSPQRRRPRRYASPQHDVTLSSPSISSPSSASSSDSVREYHVGAPFFVGGGSPSLALSLVAVACDEERVRYFFEQEAFSGHVSLVLFGGLSTLEEGVRCTACNAFLEERNSYVAAFSFDCAMTSTVETEKKRRLRWISEEANAIVLLASLHRIQRATWIDRQKINTKCLSDRTGLFHDYLYFKFYGHVSALAQHEAVVFQIIQTAFNREGLRIVVEAQQRLLGPAIARLHEEGERIEESLASAPHGRWYDAAGGEDGEDELLLLASAINGDDDDNSVQVIFEDDNESVSSISNEGSLGDFTLLPGERVDLIYAQEFTSRKQLAAEYIVVRATILLNILPMLEELVRFDMWTRSLHNVRKLHRRGITGLGINTIVEREEGNRATILHSVDKACHQLHAHQERINAYHACMMSRRRLHNDMVEEAFALKADILFTTFYERAVEIAFSEDSVFLDLSHLCRSDMTALMGRKRLFFGLRLSDGLIVPGGGQDSTAKTKEMYYHLRVADSVAPARPHIQRNDIILAVQGVQVVTLSAMKQALRLVKSNVAHFTILRSRDGTTTSVSVAGIYRDDPPSRSGSHGRF